MGAIIESVLASAVRLVHWIFSRLSPERSLQLGGWVGWLYARLGGPRVSDARINLAIAFPDWTPLRRNEVLLASFANHGRSLAEVCMLGGPGNDRIYENIRFCGLEHLEAARKRSGDAGVLVVSAHIGCWELCAAAMAQTGWPTSVVHHAFRNEEIERIVTVWRQGAGLETVKLGRAAYGIFKALRCGRFVGMLMDQNASLDDGVFAPFFGRDACTRRGPIQLAMRSGTPIVPIFIYRQGATGRHVVRAEPEIEVERGDPDDHEIVLRNVARMNDVIEAAIRRAPDQWIWAHRRWKTVEPGGAPSPYPAKRGLLRDLRKRLG